MEEFKISGYVPGAIGRITELHAIYYSKYWGFGLFFESRVAAEMCEFLDRFDNARDGFWLALINEKIVGSIAIDGIKASSHGAHLRWFFVDPKYHGRGIGSRLIQEAVTFCRLAPFHKVYLSTFAGLDSARHLYKKHGFMICEECEGEQWGVTVTEQVFELRLEKYG